MTAETQPEQEEKHVAVRSDSVYGIGLMGAWVFYFKRATTFQEGVAAFFKGFAWPAILVYELLSLLKKE